MPAQAPLHALRCGAGTPVLCLHSSAAGGVQWQALADRLPAGLMLLAPDLHGHGRSPAWPAGGASSLDVDAAAALALVPSGSDLHLVGHSYGGALALHLALQLTRHEPRRLRSLTLYEPVAFGALDALAPGAPELQEVHEIAGVTAERAALGDLMGAAAGFVDYWSGAGAFESMPPARQSSLASRMPTVARHFEALFSARWTAGDLALLDLPVLLLSGAETRAPTRRLAGLLAAALPQVQRRDLPGLPHLGPLTHPQVVVDAMLGHGAPLAVAANAPRSS